MIEHDSLDVVGVEWRNGFEALPTRGGQRCVLASPVGPVRGDLNIAALDERAQSVGESTRRQIGGIGELRQPHRVVGCRRERDEYCIDVKKMLEFTALTQETS